MNEKSPGSSTRPPVSSMPLADPGSWGARPAGVPATVPPPALPLAFFAAAAIGLAVCGLAFVLARTAAVGDPTSDPVVAAVHAGVLATLAMGIMGALHQFTPVITGRELRSIRLGWATFVTWVLSSWLLVIGVAGQLSPVATASGVLAASAVTMLVINLFNPLSVTGKGVPVLALRGSLVGSVLTSLLGVTFVLDRQANWFGLSPHADAAMGVIGLFAWLGVTYMGVAEKLWPMFMLAHAPGSRKWGGAAVSLTFVGGSLLATGLGWGLPLASGLGAALLVAGVSAHLVSLANHVRHRRRNVDIYLLFTITSALWLPISGILGLLAQLVIHDNHRLGVALSAGALACAGGWLLEALVGSSHKVVPFIVWSLMRSRGVTKGLTGRPLMFSDLYHLRVAQFTYVTTSLGIGGLSAGLAASSTGLILGGGTSLILAGLSAAANLSLSPLRLSRASRGPSATTVQSSADETDATGPSRDAANVPIQIQLREPTLPRETRATRHLRWLRP